MSSLEPGDTWVVIPATGVGQRMQADRPKQYLMLGQRCILQHTLDMLLAHPRIHGAVLIFHPQDRYRDTLVYPRDKMVLCCHGGEQRQHSVYNGLQYLRQQVTNNPHVLIHDAVRPFVSATDLDRLMQAMRAHEDGALLATPVADTLKLGDNQNRIKRTQSREHLWRALTPQAFLLDKILIALERAIHNQVCITDDASAMELAGYHPQLVFSSAMNFKITTPEDLRLARFIAEKGGVALYQ